MGKKKTVQEVLTITFGMLLVSAAVYFFMVPSEIVVGSVSGLAMVLAQVSGIQLSVLTFILNAVLLIVGFIFIGKDFAIMGQSVLTLDQQANPPIGVCEKVLGKLGLLISSEIDIAAAVINTEHRASSLGLIKGKSVLVHGEFCAALQFTADNNGRIAGTKPCGCR